MIDTLVVRLLPKPQGPPQVEFDVPGALIMSYPVKVVGMEGEFYRMEALGQFALDVTRKNDALVGEAKFYVSRKDLPATASIELKRIPAPLPIGRDLPPIAKLPSEPNFLDKFTGEYLVNSTVSLKVNPRRRAAVSRSPATRTPLPIYPMGDQRFFFKAVPDEITFGQNAEGKIVRLMLHGSRDTPARKIN